MATREAAVPLANDLIMSWRSIQLLRHFEHQNMSIISDSIGRARVVQKFWRSQVGMKWRRSTVVKICNHFHLKPDEKAPTKY